MTVHVDSIALSRRLPWLAVGLGISTLLGCSLFPTDDSVSKVESRRPSLPPIQAAREAIQLEVLFVERPADDPLLGQILWREVDETGVQPETRELLHQNGFRVGHVGSSIPPAVQTLLGLVGRGESGDDQSAKSLVGRRKILPPGMDTEVQTGEERESCQLRIIQGERADIREYHHARTLFRMTSARLQEGWVRIDFQPEIHHGENRVRHTPTEEGFGQGWGLRSRQNVDARHSHRFFLTMNVGEMAIISSTSDQPETMGDLFFCRDDGGIKKQRVLIVRVAAAGAK